MLRSRIPCSLSLLLALLCVLSLALLVYPTARTVAVSGSVERATERIRAEDVVKEAWARARDAGSYRFTADVVQTTIPLPTVTNIGRTSLQDALRVEGETNLSASTMHMALWSQGGSVLYGETGAEIRVEGDRAFVRNGAAGWEEVEDFSGGLFGSGSDPLAFLAAARDIVEQGTETRALPSPRRGEGEGGAPSEWRPLKSDSDVEGEITFTRYTFRVDGRSYAIYLRDQLERHLAERGELPPGLSLDTPRQYVDMIGEGELWIGGDGLPVRQVIHLEFPPRPDDHRVEADITVDFSDFGFGQRTADAGGDLETRGAGALVSGLRSLRSLAGDHPERVLQQAALFASTLTLIGLAVLNSRSKTFYAALTTAIIVSTLFTPVLQSVQVAAFVERHAAPTPEQAPQDRAPNPVASQQSPVASLQSTVSGLQSPSALLQQAAGGTSDLDGDGLTDYQESLLGTNPDSVDSDGDTITDTLEVQGFWGGTQAWYLDPLAIDTNGDGVDDWRECPDFPDCLDTDDDLTPDAFDRDNDGDGVPDDLDLSPFTSSSATFDPDTPLSLILNDLTESKLTDVEFQLRPVITDHLWYAFNVLDWPMGDVEGQVQDVDGRTFFREDQDNLPVSPNDNGDLRLVPMLEIRTLGEDDNLPSQAELEPYGIFIQDLQDDGSEKAVYVPLHLVTEGIGSARVAFQGRMLYRPGASWGEAHDVRLSWVLQALVDECMAYQDGACKTWKKNQYQVVHAYYDEWTLTGLNLTEHHGVSVDLIYEDPDPAVDDDLHDDAALIALGDGLDATFLAARDADGDGQRDLTIDEIYRRFDHMANDGVPDAQRWNIPDVLRVGTQTYEHPDVALRNIVTDTKTILTGTFTSRWSASAPITPTILFAREERSRATNLDVQDYGDTVTWSGEQLTQLTLDLPRSGDDGVAVQTVAGLKWTPYCYDGLAWAACGMDEYAGELAQRYPFAGEDDPQTAIGLQFGAQVYYVSLVLGATSIVQEGDVIAESADARSDQALAAKYAAALTPAGGDARPGEALIRAIFDALQVINPGTMDEFWRDLGALVAAAGLEAGGTLRSASQWPAQLASELAWLKWGGSAAGSSAGTILSGTVFVLNWATSDTDSEGGSFFDNVWVQRGIGLGKTLMGAYRIVSVANDVKKFLEVTRPLTKFARFKYFLKVSRRLTTFGKFTMYAGFALDVGLAWLPFFLGVSDMEAFSPEFNMALARALAATAVAVLLFVLGTSLVGSIVVAIFALVDGLLDLITGFSPKNWLAEQIAKSFYGYQVIVDLRDMTVRPLDPAFDDPALGLSAGNTIVVTTSVTTTVSTKFPEYWGLFLFYWDDYYNENNVRSTTVKYTLTEKQPEDLVVGRNEMRPFWDVYDFIIGYSGTADSGELPRSTVLKAGLNQQPVWLNVGWALPAASCWTLWPLPIPICSHRTARDHQSTHMGLVLDVFPATLDEFYALQATGNGGYRLAWDDAFPTLMDADGDGLLSPAHKGPDPDDTQWDTDGDCLSDAYELELRQAGISSDPGDPDTDGDGLSDALEARLGTDPASADTDNDGLDDEQEVDGWPFDADGLTTRVTSDPVLRDTDGDGIDDRAEYALGSPYHPRVWNSSPIGLYTQLGDEDGFVQPGQAFAYTATVRNNFDVPLYAHGDLVAGFSEVLGVDGNTGVDGTVYAIAASEDGNEVYVVGDFTQAGGVSANRVARWDRATGTWSALGMGLAGCINTDLSTECSPRVNAVAVGRDYVYVGGHFTTAGGVPVNNIARWNRASKTWSTMESGIRGCWEPRCVPYVGAIVVSGDDVYVGGHFTNAGGVSASNVARWSRATESWSAMGGGVAYPEFEPAMVRAISVRGDDVYVGGAFFTAGVAQATNVARWNRATASWYAMGGGVDGPVVAVAAWEDDVYVGGSFSRAGGAGGVTANNIARWSRTATAETWSALADQGGNGVDARVGALAVNRVGNVYVGGNFSTAGGVTASHVARWTGTGWQALGTDGTGGANGPVTALVAAGSQVYAGGGFDQVGGVDAGHLAGWNDLLERWVWPDQAFFTLFQDEEVSMTRELIAVPDAGTQSASIDNAQRSQFNDVGYAGPWDWDARRESARRLSTGERAWHTAVAPLPGREGYRVAALVDDPADPRYALRFDGTDDYVDVGEGIDIAGESLTVEFWARRDVIDGYHTVLGQGYPGTMGRAIGFRGDRFSCAVSLDGLETPADAGTDWHHWACTFDASTNLTTIYRDGMQVAQNTASIPIGGSGPLYIGRAHWGGGNFDGLIDEVRVWSVARAQEQVEADMGRTLTGSERGLVGYWRFDEGSGGTAYDQTDNDNDGTLVPPLNGPAWDGAGAALLKGGRIAVYTADEDGFSSLPVTVDDPSHAKHPTPPAVACTGDGTCLVAWSEEHEDTFDVYGVIVEPDVSPGTPFVIADSANCASVTFQTLNCDDQTDGDLGPGSEVRIELDGGVVWRIDGIEDSSSHDVGGRAGFCGQATVEVWEEGRFPIYDRLLASWSIDAQSPGATTQAIDVPSKFTGSLEYEVAADNDELWPSVASDGTGFLVGWDRLGGDGQIWSRRADVTGTLGAALRLDDKGDHGSQGDFHVDLAWSGDKYIAVWENRGNTTGPDVWAAAVSSEGAYEPGSAQPVARTGAREEWPQVACNPDSGRALVAYRYDGDDVHGKFLQGHNVSNALVVGSRGTHTQLTYPRVAYDPVHASWLAAWGVRTGDGRPAVNFQALRGDEPGPALRLDGVDDYVDLPDNFPNVTDFTFEAWVYWHGGNNWQRVFDFGQDTGHNMFLTPRSGANTLRFAITTAGSDAEERLDAGLLPTNQWVHVAVTLQGGTGTLYVNGIAADSQPIALDPSDVVGGNTWLGRSQYADPFFDGLIDEVRVWNVALTQDQIQAGMNRTLTGDDPSLVGYWRFDESWGSTAHDQTVNGNDGTILGGPVRTADHAPFLYTVDEAGSRQQYTWPSALSPRGTSLACTRPMGPRMLWLRFEESPGTTTFADDTFNTNPGFCFGDTCPDAGAVGQVGAALRFDGVDDHIQVDHNASLDPGGELTMAAWVNIRSSGDRAIVGKRTFDSGYLLGVSDGRLAPEIWDWAVQPYTAAWGTVLTGTWTHLAVTWRSGGDMIGYIDGQEVGRIPASAEPIRTNWQPLRVGADSWDPGTSLVSGLIDEVVIFKRALSAEQVQDLYAGSYDAACALTANDAPWAGDAGGNLYYDRLNLRWPARWLGTVESPEPMVVTVTIDADPPAVSTVTSLSDGQYLQGAGQTLIIGGVASDTTSYVAQVAVSVNDGPWEPASGAGSWAYEWQVPAAPGAYTLRTRATDAVGNILMEADGTTVFVDVYPPDVPPPLSSGDVISASLNVEDRWTVPLNGTVTDRLDFGGPLGSGVASVEVMLEGSGSVVGQGWQTATLTSPGGQVSDWGLDYVLPLYDDDKQAIVSPTGEYTVLVRATDNVGNLSPSPTAVPLRIDSTPPVVEITTIGASTNVITRPLIIGGIITDPGVVAGGLAGLEIAYTPAELIDSHPISELLPLINWRTATLAGPGEGVTVTTWTHTVPGSPDGLGDDGLEGIYQIDLRGTDVLGNRNDDLATWGQWRGEIDTLAPRVTVDLWHTGAGVAAHTLYACRAEDFRLDGDSFACPCRVLPSDRTTYDTPWWRTWISDTAQLHRIETSCIAPGHRSASTAFVDACDRYGWCNHTVADAAATLPSLLGSVVLTPTYGAVLTTTGPISVAGSVWAEHPLGLAALTVTVDSGAAGGVPIYASTWVSQTSWEEAWSTTWSPLAEGPHTLSSVATDHHGTVQTDTHPITVVVDTLAPEITVPAAVLTTAHRLSFGRVALTGSYTETGGVAAIRVQVDAPGLGEGHWFDAAPIDDDPSTGSGQAWRSVLYLGEEPDNKAYDVTAVITDVAGRTAQASNTITVDLVRRVPITVTLAYTNSSGVFTQLTPGQTIRDVLSPTLVVTWTAASSSDVRRTYVGWTEDERPDLSVLTVHAPGVSGRHEQGAGEAQALYAHIVVQDGQGNEQPHTLGPIYADVATTPDYILLPSGGGGGDAYHGWMESGATQIGADRELARNGYSGQALTGTQRLYMTWGAQQPGADALRLAWTGANWDGDGDLFVYFDTGVPGGALVAYNPYTTTMTNTVIGLPAQRGQQLAADYLMWVEDAQTVTLMRWNGGGWEAVDPPFPAEYCRLDTTVSPAVTDLYIPFALLGIAEPGNATLGLVALASEEDALRLWAAMPEKNPLNSGRVVDTPGAIAATQRFTLTQQYEWTSLGPGLYPNAGQFTDADLRVDIAGNPPGVEVGYLEHDLLYLAPGRPIDADLDGQPDMDLPLDTVPSPVGLDQVITYTVRYANAGSGVAPGARVTVTARGPLQLSDAVPLPGGEGVVLSLGDVDPGVTATLEFTGTVDGSAGAVEVGAVVADEIHGPFDWLWIQHGVDIAAPEDLAIVEPLVYIKPSTNTVHGIVADRSSVPTIRMEAVPVGGSGPRYTWCTDDTPDDGHWGCAWNVGDADSGDQFALRAQATDRFGNISAWSDPVTLTVDTLAPTISLDADAQAALQEAVLGPGDQIVLTGQVQDDQQAQAAEICLAQAYDQFCEDIDVHPGDAIMGTWSHKLLAEGQLDNEVRTFTLYGFDGAGRRSTVPLSHTYSVDTVPPLVTVTTRVDWVRLISGTLVLGGTFSDGGSVSEMYVSVETPGGDVSWDPVARIGNTWSYKMNPQTDGIYILRILARDPSGNTSEYGPFEVFVVSEQVYLPLVVRLAGPEQVFLPLVMKNR